MDYQLYYHAEGTIPQQDKVEMEAKHREGKVEAEAVRQKDRAEIFAYLLQVIGTQDYEPLKELLKNSLER